MSVINGVRVRGFGTRNFTWKVNYALSSVAGLKTYFTADYAALRALGPAEEEIDRLELDEEISSREADRRYKALEARENEEGRWFPIKEGLRTVAAVQKKLGEKHPAASDLRELATLLKKASAKGKEFRLYSNP